MMVFVVEYWLSQLWTQFMQLRYVVWKIHGFYGVWTSKHAWVVQVLINFWPREGNAQIAFITAAILSLRTGDKIISTFVVILSMLNQ